MWSHVESGKHANALARWRQLNIERFEGEGRGESGVGERGDGTTKGPIGVVGCKSRGWGLGKSGCRWKGKGAVKSGVGLGRNWKHPDAPVGVDEREINDVPIAGSEVVLLHCLGCCDRRIVCYRCAERLHTCTNRNCRSTSGFAVVAEAVATMLPGEGLGFVNPFCNLCGMSWH